MAGTPGHQGIIAVGSSVSNVKPISLDPSAMQWSLQDVSHGDAGRVQDGENTMYKMRTSQKRKLALTWTMPTVEQAAEILRAFNPEYFYVRYFDPMDAQYEVRQFYAGDRSAPFKWVDIQGGTRLTTISFDIIER